MLRHTINDYSHEMRVPDVQQHVVHPPRSIAPSMPASEDPGYHRHLDKYFNYDSHSADSLNTQSLLRLAGNLIQACHRPACEPEHGSQSVQLLTRQRVLAGSTATGHVGYPRPLLLDQPSWHSSDLERLLTPCRDRVQSLHSKEYLRCPTHPEST